MKVVPGSQVTESMNWADYCDALRAEHWLRRLDRLKQPKRTEPLIKPVDDDSLKSAARKVDL